MFLTAAEPSITPLQAAPDLADQVYERLVEAISDGTLAPGARIRQEELAEQFGVSRQPVLQALRVLKRDGLVLDAPGRGVCVASLSSELIGSVYQLRGALDTLAAGLAAQLKARIDPALVQAGRAAAASRNVGALIKADINFHRAIYTASRNPLIEQSARLHWCHIRRAMGAVLQGSSIRQAVWDEHEAIVRAISQGKVERAQELMADHCRAACDFIMHQLDLSLPKAAS